ncbi:TM1812 family CRISPR-associated protein [Oribacterium sp. FC2011]|uniref:TM1812 family CRISPR-associated protein n=1 Tax=Oribacterium sp. FC2011 TaxID=1408311 RepID=UPI0004E12824|nr:TM1812 family CRISPR-associated protein [Oribacterium sp. FC2011]
MSENKRIEDINEILTEELAKRKLYVSNDKLEYLSKAVVQIYNRMNIGAAFNPNVIICAVDYETAYKFGYVLAEILEMFFPDICAEISEEELYGKKRIEKVRAESKVRIVRNFKAASPELLFDCLDKLEKDGWPQTVVLCTTTKDIEAIKDYNKQDYRLYNYMCGYKVFIPEVDESNIPELVFERLDREGYELTDGFKKKLDIYVRAVYQEASLSQKAFLEDLIHRIYQVHYQKLAEGMQLDESDVPYSEKAKKLEESELKELADSGRNDIPESKQEDKEDSSSHDEKREHQDINLIESLTINTDCETPSDTVNILITNVSKVSEKRRVKIYKDEESKLYNGEMTNEAPIKSIANRLGQKGEKLNAILFIESEEVRTGKISIGATTYSHIGYLKEKIEEFLGEYVKDTEFIDIEIKDEPSKDDVSTTVFEIYNKLLEMAEDNRNINIFIESNGGVRYVLTMLLSLTKTLENYYENVHIKEITSMVYDQNQNNDQNPTKIVNTKDVYDTAQITGIADEFVNYGRTNSLQRYVEGYLKDLTPDQRQDVQITLDKLKKISDDIQLCRSTLILDDFYGKNNLKSIIEEFTDKYKKKDIPAIISIFNHVLQLILNELNQTVYKDLKAVVVDEELKEDGANSVNLPQMIEWCLNKSFIQQALTFVAERLPLYLFVTGKISHNKNFSNKNIGNYEKHYYFIAHLQEFKDWVNKSRIDKILEMIEESGELKEIIPSEKWDSIRNYKGIPEAKITDDLIDIACKVTELIKEYRDLINKHRSFAAVSEDDLNRLFEKRFNKFKLNEEFHFSNQYTSTLHLALRGKCYDKDKKEKIVEISENLKSLEDIIVRTLHKIVSVAVDCSNSVYLAKAKEDYDALIEGLFIDEKLSDLFKYSELSNSLKIKYSEKQSEKFFIKDAFDSGHITSNMRYEDIQKLLYIYSVCKEQRNFSNHAYVSKDDRAVALNSECLKIVIKTLLRICESDN